MSNQTEITPPTVMLWPLAEPLQHGEYQWHGSQYILLWQGEKLSTENHKQNAFPTLWDTLTSHPPWIHLAKYISFSSRQFAAYSGPPVKRQLEHWHFQTQGWGCRLGKVSFSSEQLDNARLLAATDSPLAISWASKGLNFLVLSER